MKGNCGECDLRWACDIDPNKCNEWPDPAPMTNAQKIRAMSDEELAIFLSEWAKKPWAWEGDAGVVEHWLQQPAEEDRHEKV